MKSSPLRRTCTAALIASLAFCTAACGSDDNSYSYGNGFNQNQINQFAARFLGTSNLGGQNSSLDITVDNAGTATGTMIVTNPPMRAINPLAVTIPGGTYNVTGTVNPNTGAFSLTGTIVGFGNFTINGVLPTGTAQGNYLVTINGQNYPGVIQNSTQGQPSGSTGTQHIIATGTSSNAVFTPGGSYNGLPGILSSPIIGGVVVTDSSTSNLVTISLTSGTSPLRNLTFGVVTHGAALQLNSPYNLITDPNGEGALVTYQQIIGTAVDKAWAQGSGTVTITSLTNSAVEVDYNFTNIPINSAQDPNNAQGTIQTISGHAVGNFL